MTMANIGVVSRVALRPLIRISRRSVLVSFKAEVLLVMNNNTGTINGTTVVVVDQQSMYIKKVFAGFYVIGIFGCLLALLHLHQKINFKNSKQAFMLKWVFDIRLSTLTASGLITWFLHFYHRVMKKGV